jgi:hypothetical protein
MANHMIAADSNGPRQRMFSENEEIIFDDTIYTSECHPGQGRYTYLKYKTSNLADWKSNEVDLLERGSKFKVTVQKLDTNLSCNSRSQCLRGHLGLAKGFRVAERWFL